MKWPFVRPKVPPQVEPPPKPLPKVLNMVSGDTLTFNTNGGPWYIPDSHGGGLIVQSPVLRWVLISQDDYDEYRELRELKDEKVKCPTCATLYSLLWH